MKTSNTITLKKPQLIFIIVSIIVTTLIAIERRAVAWAMLEVAGGGEGTPQQADFLQFGRGEKCENLQL